MCKGIGMRVVLLVMTVLLLQQPSATRLRLLLRDETGAGVAGATLTLRLDNEQVVTLVTNADGVVVSDALTGQVAWLKRGQQANGAPLIADSEPPDVGFRLVLLPGQVRDVLLRLDGDRIVLDPDMIFSPNEPGEQPVPTVAALAATVLPVGAVAQPIMAATAAHASTGADQAAFSVLWCLALGGVLLLAGAISIAVMRQRAQR